MGIATDRKSKDEAVKLALSNCAANSNNDHCELVQWAGNGCLAIAVSQPDASFGAATLADSRLGAWVQAMTNCRKANAPNCAIVSTPCASDDPRLSTPFPPPPNASGDTVDPATVGTWEAPMNPGRWVWEIAPNGAYEFHTEAPDGAPSHAGGFASANGKWKLQSNVGYSDSDDGTYQMQGPDAMAMSGKLGLGTWHRIKK